MPYAIRLITPDGITTAHHDGDKASARERARRMAEYHWPKEDGYRHKWSNDAVMVFRDGQHVGDCAVDPLVRTERSAP